MEGEQTGAPLSPPCPLPMLSSHPPTEYIWGVVDMHPRTDFPDIRNKSAIHSSNGSCMVIPREDGLVRLYIQLADADVVDPRTGRVDKARVGPDRLLEVRFQGFAYPVCVCE
jgi:phenol 2-monooxygenase